MTDSPADQIPVSAASEEDYSADLTALGTVVAAMQRLDPLARQRLLTTVAAFFNLSMGRGNPPVTTNTRGLSDRTNAQSDDATFSEDRSLSPKEFLLQKKPLTDIERVACLAYYLTHYRDTPQFKTLELSQLNTEAAQVKFSNAAKGVDNATRAGLLIATTKGNKQISANGELYVQALPDRQAAREAVAHVRPRRKSKKVRGGSTDLDTHE
jgi:hypothetical protein